MPWRVLPAAAVQWAAALASAASPAVQQGAALDAQLADINKELAALDAEQASALRLVRFEKAQYSSFASSIGVIKEAVILCRTMHRGG